MSDYIQLGKVQSGGRSSYYYSVAWDEYTQKVYCDNHYIGKASSSREAMHMAEAWSVQN